MPTTEALCKLGARGFTTKQWTSKRGTRHGGQRLSMSTLRLLLTNVLYREDISHKDMVHPGEHESIVSRELWLEVNTGHSHTGAMLSAGNYQAERQRRLETWQEIIAA